MRLVKEPDKSPIIFRGECKGCGAEFEAFKNELQIEYCPREHFELARKTCTLCGGDIIMYKKN